MNRKYIYTILSIVLFIIKPGYGQDYVFQNWPEGSSPEEIGNRVSNWFLKSKHGVYNAPGTKPHIPYFEVCTWYGALAFAKERRDKKLAAALEKRFLPLLDEDSALLPVPDHVDYTVFGALPLELFMQTKKSAYLHMGTYYANSQWGEPVGPRVTADSWKYYNQGLTWQTRLWIDDMYMITLVQAQMFRATGRREYIDRAAKEMVFYLDTLQRENGLFYHAPDAPFYWGRGNGWMAAGMTELLKALPTDNPDRPRILEGYKKMMASLLKYQSKDGMWRQLVDDETAWPETSCTGMFTYAMITGVKKGWLSRIDYGPAARKGWLALVTYLNDKNELREVCEGTGKKNDRQYYLDRKRITGDFHGQAPVLWCAAALVESR